jgi:hypothetical protein
LETTFETNKILGKFQAANVQTPFQSAGLFKPNRLSIDIRTYTNLLVNFILNKNQKTITISE